MRARVSTGAGSVIEPSLPKHRTWPVHARASLVASAVLWSCATGISDNCIGESCLPAGGGAVGLPAGGQVIDVRPSPAGRFARLTHAQWENSIRDLLGLAEVSGLAEGFPADARTAGFLFDNHELSLEIDQVLSNAYASAAEELAREITADPRALARLLPPASSDDRERARAFISLFGERTFRRPLEPAEIDTFLSLYERGTTSYDEVSGFTAGVRLLIEAFLQSPYFLYRVEGSTRVAGATIPLSDWEVGQRLSYVLTNTTPDAELLEAARAGNLSTPAGVRAQALRLLSSPAAGPALVGFHGQLLEFEKFESIRPSPSFYPDISPSFAEDVVTSSQMFIEDLVVNQAGSFSDMMTSDEAFVNAELARVYGLEGRFGEAFVKAQLPAAERRGIFNQLGFLAANSTSVNPDPIHRGVFIATRVMCLGIAAPPDGVPPLPPITEGTNRQVVANHTESSPVCSACHSNLINPFGFPFENYDATGAFRTLDNGAPVDASASPFIDGERVSVQSSVELAEALSESRDAHECFASHLVEYAFGRSRASGDDELIASLTEASLEGTPILELLIRIAESPAFMTRSTEELP